MRISVFFVEETIDENILKQLEMFEKTLHNARPLSILCSFNSALVKFNICTIEVWATRRVKRFISNDDNEICLTIHNLE